MDEVMNNYQAIMEDFNKYIDILNLEFMKAANQNHNY